MHNSAVLIFRNFFKFKEVFMTTIKISSNPYEKKISYAVWDNNNDCWKDINAKNNPNSKLLGRDLCGKFFPFCVKDIVDEIYNSFNSSDESIKIVFEGSPDEFEELKSYCDMHPEKKVLPEYSQFKLSNAKELLPEIIKIFNEVRPLVSEEIRHANPSIDNDLNKFSDASNDIVPLCVVGNYSSGKSSFINALIGKEILPIGDNPVTAKVYKIQNSKNKRKASVKFSAFNKSLEILFDSDRCELKTEIYDTNDFLVKLKSVIEEGNKGDMASKIRTVLKFINADKRVSDADLVEISIDFSGDTWDSLPNRFIIFDTPGSNSASNEKHFQVLMKSMEGLSNGLPIFVANYDTLDTKDNDELYERIKGLEALDNRFSMIVVNKADRANLPKVEKYDNDKIAQVLSQSVPKNLYSMGIFYLSSIVGLGYKLNGNFDDSEEDLQNTPAEIFEGEKGKYLDSESKFYKSLYKYNIMPEQIKERFKSESENYKENLLYSNSGLFAIEHAIKLFTEKYSSYNKCSQSRMFLEKIIGKTKDEVDHKKKDIECRRAELRSELDVKKKALVEELNKKRIELLAIWNDVYNKNMNEYLLKEKMNKRNEAPFNAESFTKLYCDSQSDFDLLDKYVELLIVSKRYKSNPPEMKNLYDKLYDNPSTRKILHEKGWSVDSESKKRELKLQDKNSFIFDYDTDKIMREKVSLTYQLYMDNMQTCLNEYSIKFWQEQEIEMKKQFAYIIDNKEIEDKDKNVLKNVMTKYEEMKFPGYDFGDFILDLLTFFVRAFWRSIDNYRSVVFNQADKILPDVLKELKLKHYSLFDKWSEALLNEIDNHIIELNPDLKAKSIDISKKTKEIEVLESNLNKLEGFNISIKRKMALPK